MSIAEFLPEPGRSFFMRPLRGGAFARAIRAVFEFALPGDNPRSPARLVSSRTAALIVASCVALTPGLRSAANAADRNPNSGIPVLVVPEDEAPDLERRSGPIAKAAARSLQDELKKAGFHVLSEEAVKGDHGWKTRDGMSAKKLIDMAKLSSKSGQAEHQIRALLVFAIHADTKFLPAVTKVSTTLYGKVIDLPSNRFLGEFRRKSAVRHLPPYRRGSRCHACEETIEELSTETARDLGPVVRKIMAFYRGAEESVYTIRLQDFGQAEAENLASAVMDKALPGYKSHELIRTAPAMRSYRYVTSDGSAEIEKRIAIQLRRMKLDPDKDAIILIRGNRIYVEKNAGTR